MPSISDFAKGFTNLQYPGHGGGPSALTKFFFGFDFNVDNHLGAILAMPGGSKEDASPNAQGPLETVADNTIDLMFADKSPTSSKDRYLYTVAHSMINGRRFQIRDVGCTGSCERVINIPGGTAGKTFLLTGFFLFFTGGRDRPIDEIAIFEENGVLFTKFNDRNDDDVYGYTVDFVMVDQASLNLRLGTETGEARGAVGIPMPTGPKLIRGFHFDHHAKDRPMREIGVVMEDSRMLVFFGDKNGDDLFSYRIDWAMPQ